LAERVQERERALVVDVLTRIADGRIRLPRAERNHEAMTREKALRILGATPQRLRDLVHDLSPAQLGRQPADGEWTISEIVNHLLLGERDVILPRLRRMREEDAPSFPSSLDDRTGFAAAPIADEAGWDVERFRLVRHETLAFLRALEEADWHRRGTTPTRGTLTIEAYVEYLAAHDVEHLAHLQQLRARVTGEGSHAASS